MLAAISKAIVTSAASTSSLRAAASSNPVTRCQFGDSRRLCWSRLNRKLRKSASVTRLVPSRIVTGRASGRAQPERGLLVSLPAASDSVMRSITVPSIFMPLILRLVVVSVDDDSSCRAIVGSPTLFCQQVDFVTECHQLHVKRA